MAITWRNVDAPNFTGANILLRDAGDRIGTGFDGFRKVFDENTQNQQKALEQTKNYNTGQFLDRLAGYRDPAALEAAIQNGEIDQLRQQYGAMINQDQVRNAVDARGSFLRKDATERMGYQNTAQDFQDAPIRDRLLAEARQIDVSDPSKVEAQLNLLEGKIAESGLSARGQASVAQGLVDIRKSLLGDYKTTTDIDNEKIRLNDQLKTSAQNRMIQGNQHQWQLDARNAEIAATEVMRNGGSLEDIRGTVMKTLGNAPIGTLNAVLDKTTNAYTQMTGVTPEQEQERVRQLMPYEAEVATAQKYVDSMPMFSEASKQNVSVSDAIGQIMKLVPGEEDDTSRMLTREVERLLQDKTLNIPKDANLGPAVLAAAKMAGLDEALIGDDSFNKHDIRRSLKKAYLEMVQYEGYQKQLNAAKVARDTANQNIMDRYKITNSLKPSK